MTVLVREAKPLRVDSTCAGPLVNCLHRERPTELGQRQKSVASLHGQPKGKSGDADVEKTYQQRHPITLLSSCTLHHLLYLSPSIFILQFTF